MNPALRRGSVGDFTLRCKVVSLRAKVDRGGTFCPTSLLPPHPLPHRLGRRRVFTASIDNYSRLKPIRYAVIRLIRDKASRLKTKRTIELVAAKIAQQSREQKPITFTNDPATSWTWEMSRHQQRAGIRNASQQCATRRSRLHRIRTKSTGPLRKWQLHWMVQGIAAQ